MQSILITGGAGYIGSHIAFLMTQQGYHVIILDALVHGQTWNHSWATCIQGDYGNKQLLNEIFSTYLIDIVIHCAASIEVGKSVSNPLAFYYNNVNNTVTLLQIMIAYGVKKILFSSSCAVYGQPQIMPIPEEHPTIPISPYGHTKRMIETILTDVEHAHKLRYITLRYFNVAGAMPEYGLAEIHEPETHVIPLILRAIRDQKPFYVYGIEHQTNDGTCIRDYVHVWDIAHAHMHALNHLHNNSVSDCFNLGTGRGLSIKEIIESAQKICNAPIKTIATQKRTGDPPILIADPSRARAILQWKPHYSDLDFILQTAYAAEYTMKAQSIHHTSQV